MAFNYKTPSRVISFATYEYISYLKINLDLVAGPHDELWRRSLLRSTPRGFVLFTAVCDQHYGRAGSSA